MFRNENKVALHCRKVLIDAEPKGLFPEWLRFLKGVVDSSDLPLNVSRETMQDSELLRKLNQVLTKRFLRFLNEQSKKQSEVYLEFWKEFNLLKKELQPILPTVKTWPSYSFESTTLEKGELTVWTSIWRNGSEQRKFFSSSVKVVNLSKRDPILRQ